ncbi:MAG: hypothetical protein ACK4NF_03020 [Planctomycetota bacterium]
MSTENLLDRVAKRFVVVNMGKGDSLYDVKNFIGTIATGWG